MACKFSMIAAISNNGVIGDEGKIPWHIKSDLRRFRMMTEGKTIIVGRNTFEQLKDAYFSRGKKLPDRNYIILTTAHDYVVDIPKCFVCRDIDSAFRMAKEIEKDEVFVSGGGAIFALTIDLVERLYLTIVDIEVEGDAFFPDYSSFKKIVSEEVHEEGGVKYRYLTLERV